MRSPSDGVQKPRSALSGVRLGKLQVIEGKCDTGRARECARRGSGACAFVRGSSAYTRDRLWTRILLICADKSLGVDVAVTRTRRDRDRLHELFVAKRCAARN